MSEITYKGHKYTQAKSAEAYQAMHLKYCGYEIMSKKSTKR